MSISSDIAQRVCRNLTSAPLIDCYFCSGGYELLTSDDCTNTGGYATTDDLASCPTTCYYCDGSTDISAPTDCSNNGGYAAQSDANDTCVNTCYTCDNIQGNDSTITDCNNAGGYQDQEIAVSACGLVDCWSCVNGLATNNPVADEQTCIDNGGSVSSDNLTCGAVRAPPVGRLQ